MESLTNGRSPRTLKEAALGGASAARGCPNEGGRSLFLGELQLRGAAQLKEGEGSFWGSCRCAGLRAQLKEGEGSFWAAPAARGCSIEGGRRLLWGEIPLAGLPD